MPLLFPASNPETLAWDTPRVEKLKVYFSGTYFKILIGSHIYLESSLGTSTVIVVFVLQIQQLGNCPKIKVKDKFHHRLKNQPKSIPCFWCSSVIYQD